MSKCTIAGKDFDISDSKGYEQALLFIKSLQGNRRITICEDCKWWDEDDPESKRDEGKCQHGDCRRYPPVMKGNKYAYPHTDDFAWCGEFKSKVCNHAYIDGVGSCVFCGENKLAK